MNPAVDSKSVPRVPHATTAVPDVRAIPLQQLANLADAMLRRIVPQPETERVPVAAFDASL